MIFFLQPTLITTGQWDSQVLFYISLAEIGFLLKLDLGLYFKATKPLVLKENYVKNLIYKQQFHESSYMFVEVFHVLTPWTSIIRSEMAHRSNASFTNELSINFILDRTFLGRMPLEQSTDLAAKLCSISGERPSGLLLPLLHKLIIHLSQKSWPQKLVLSTDFNIFGLKKLQRLRLGFSSYMYMYSRTAHEVAVSSCEGRSVSGPGVWPSEYC